jgi:hypothetical protein
LNFFFVQHLPLQDAGRSGGQQQALFQPLVLLSQRESTGEGRAFTFLAFNSNIPAHHSAEVAADHQPQSSAAVFTGGG